jgi:hypothetical protein
MGLFGVNVGHEGNVDTLLEFSLPNPYTRLKTQRMEYFTKQISADVPVHKVFNAVFTLNTLIANFTVP